MIVSIWHSLLSSAHDWGWPRRVAEFEGHENVDVQTCTRCGARRLSPLQFDSYRAPVEVRA
jgi:hypothetical protein